MNSKIFYIARFNPPKWGDTRNTQINYSVNRKVSGTCAALKLNKNRCYIIRTSTGEGDIFLKSKVNRYQKQIVITPRLIDAKIRVVTYVLNICISTLLCLSLARRCRPKYIIFWDLLPDTAIPALMSSLFFRNIRIIPDIEELISADCMAPKLFSWFERILMLIPWKTILTAGMEVDGKLKYENKIEIKGYFAESLDEEVWCKKQLESRARSKNPALTTIVFTGRIDDMRGYREFLELSKIMVGNAFKFKAFGFGKQTTLDYYEDLSNGFIETSFHADRKSVLKGIINSDFCFNYISDLKFSNNSFPSKLVEYHCLGNNIVSNHDVADPEITLHVFTDLSSLKEYINTAYDTKKRLSFESKLSSFSIAEAASKLSRLNQCM